MLLYLSTPTSIGHQKLFTRKTFGSSDIEVTGRNNITFKDLIIRNQHSVLKIDDRNFSFNLKEKPLESQKFVSRTGVSTITYSTTSSTARGPIFKTKINFPGRGYTILPKVIGFASTQGQDGIVKVSSPDIGKIDLIERIKEEIEERIKDANQYAYLKEQHRLACHMEEDYDDK